MQDMHDVQDVQDVEDMPDVQDLEDLVNVEDVQDVQDMKYVQDAQDLEDVEDVQDVKGHGGRGGIDLRGGGGRGGRGLLSRDGDTFGGAILGYRWGNLGLFWPKTAFYRSLCFFNFDPCALRLTPPTHRSAGSSGSPNRRCRLGFSATR